MNKSLLKKILKHIVYRFVGILSPFIVDTIYGGFWNYRNSLRGGVVRDAIYNSYMERNHFFIGEKAQFDSEPILPHGINGIHISSHAIIGKNVVIFHHVTIGSNTILGRRYGSPIIGNNVYIGCGAKIIGKVSVGDNCRIGANAVVVKDMKPNTIAVNAPTRFILSDTKLINDFKPI